MDLYIEYEVFPHQGMENNDMKIIRSLLPS